MKNWSEKVSEALMPVAQKISGNRYLSAIKEGFFGAMPILYCGLHDNAAGYDAHRHNPGKDSLKVWKDKQVYLFSLLIQLVIPAATWPILRLLIAEPLIRGITLI